VDETERDVIESVGDYAVAELGDEYIVYAKSRPDEILGRFPAKDDGFIEAEALYHRLIAPLKRQRYVKVFLVGFFAALAIHVLSVAFLSLLQASQGSSFSFGESGSTLMLVVERWASTAAAISNTAWIAALAGMAGIWLARRVFQKEVV
jgi:hypothetical protein